MRSFSLSVLAADHPLYVGECVSLVVPTHDGQYGVMANHSNTIAAIVPGAVKFTLPDGTVHKASVSYGMIKIESNEVLLLVDSATSDEQLI